VPFNRFKASAVISQRQWRHLFRVAKRVTGEDADAEDAVQSAILSALERVLASEQPANWLAWLTIIVKRTAFNMVRSRRRRAGIPLLDYCIAVSEEGTLQGWKKITERQLFDALGTCHPVIRETFRLWYTRRLPQDEIARLQRVPVGTVATRLYRARLRVRTALQAELIADHSSGSKP
jgi:RNA polymerase sigma-70 factor (ECF subfamily)